MTSISESGRVYASGFNKFGQLGISDDSNYIVVSNIDSTSLNFPLGYYFSMFMVSAILLLISGKAINPLGLSHKNGMIKCFVSVE